MEPTVEIRVNGEVAEFCIDSEVVARVALLDITPGYPLDGYRLEVESAIGVYVHGEPDSF